MKRLGDVDGLSREFAREHSGRLWKQLLVSGDDEPARPSSGWLETLVFAVAAAVAIQVARLAAGFPDEEPTWLARNASSVRAAVPRRVLRPPAAARRPAMAADGGAVRARRARGQPLPVRCGLGHRGPRRAPSARRAVVRVAYPYMGGTVRSHERRMDFVRFTGEWFIYYVLIALGGGVLMGLTAAILEPTGVDVDRIAAVGAAFGSGGCRDRGRVARRVEATGRGEHGAGAHDALHAAVRGDAGRRCRRLRRDRARRRVRSRAPQRLRRAAGGRPRARPVRDVRAGPVHVVARTGWTASSWSPSSAPSCST